MSAERRERMEGVQLPSCTPPPPSSWMTLSHDSSWNRYLGPFVRGSCWVSVAARSGWKADDALHLPGIIWDRLACRLAAVNHHQYSINYLMFDLCFALRFVFLLFLLLIHKAFIFFLFFRLRRLLVPWLFVLIARCDFGLFSSFWLRCTLSGDFVYVIRRACSASCSNKGRRKTTSKKYIANIKSKLRAQMQTSFAQTKSELAPPNWYPNTNKRSKGEWGTAVTVLQSPCISIGIMLGLATPCGNKLWPIIEQIVEQTEIQL